jgi:hypothetical protein
MSGFGDGGSENIYITAENLGIPGQTNDGLGWYSHQFDSTLFFKRIKAGASVTLSETDNSIIVSLAAGSGPGEANDGANLGSGQGVFAMKSGLNLQFKSIVAGTNTTMTSDSTTITINSASDIINASNLGAGQAIFANKAAGVLNFKSIVAGSNITLIADANTITISAPNAGTGSINNASNLGSGTGIFTDKVVDVLRFKSIIAGNNITVNSDSNNITINAAGDITTAASLGTGGAQVWSYKSGNSLYFRRIIAGSNVTVQESTNYVTLSTASDVLNGYNLGSGTGVFSGKIAGILNFKSLQAGNNVSITTDDNSIFIEALGGGVINSGQNIGLGQGLYAQAVGDTLQFKSLIAGPNVTLTPSANTMTISAVGDVNAGQNLTSSGARVFSGKVTNTLQFRRILAGTNVTLVENANEIVISSDQGVWGTIEHGRNLDSGQGVFAQVNGDTLEFKSLVAGNHVVLSSDPTSITIDVPSVGEINTVSNVGLAGARIFKQKVGVDFQLRRFVSGQNITITENTSDISIATINCVINAANLGSGEPLFHDKNADILNFKSIKAGANIQLDADATSITINAVGAGTGSINDGINLGTGLVQLFAGKSFDILQFKTFQAGTNITLTEVSNTITVSSVSEVSNAANLGSTGSRVFSTKSSGVLQFRRLIAGSGVSLVENTNDITITSTGGGGGGGAINTAANLGAGNILYASTSPADTLNFKSLVAGTNVSITNDSNTVTINSTSDVTNASNLGTGYGLFTSKLSGLLQLKGLKAGTGISIASDSTSLTITSTAVGGGLINTAANLGAGNVLYASTSPSDTLNFKSLVAGTNVSITNDSNTVTINSVSDVTNASNLGVGTGLFSIKSAGVLQFKTLVAGTNTSISTDSTTVTVNSVSDVTNASNLGASGSSVFSAKSAGVLQFRKLIAGAGISVTQNTNDVTIAATGSGSGDMLKSTYDTNNNGIVDNSEALNGQSPSYYLSRANHTGTQAASTITGLSPVATTGAINDLADVTITSPSIGQVLTWSGTQWINGAGGGGGSTTETRLLSFDSGNIVIRASGTSSDLSSVTATKDFSTSSRSTLILNKPTSVVYHSIQVLFTAAETSGRTEVGLQAPDCNSATSVGQAIRPFAVRMNLATNGIGGTSSTFTLITGTTYLTLLTGFTGSSDQKSTFTL